MTNYEKYHSLCYACTQIHQGIEGIKLILSKTRRPVGLEARLYELTNIKKALSDELQPIFDKLRPVQK